MRRQKRLVWAAVGTVMASLCLAALTGPYDSGIGEGWRSGFAAWRLAACCLGAVGVIVLGLAYHRLARTVASIARQLTWDSAAATDLQTIERAAETVQTRLQDGQKTIAELETELKDLRLRSRLSERQKQHTEAIIYSLRDAVVVVDESDRLLMANTAAAHLFAFDPEQARYQPLGRSLDAQYEDFVELIQRSRQSATEATRREMAFAGPDGPRTFDTIVSCVQEQDKVSGVVAVLHDITREKEVSQMKNDFVSHVSHELKTPLASITAYSEMLVDGEADDEQTRKEFYRVIQSQAQRLNRLIEDILNVSRIESGLIKVQKEPVSLTILIEQQMQMIKGFAEDKGITVTGCNPIVYDQVMADKDMISQVIVNLLSNAVKYTPAGGSVRIETDVNEVDAMARVIVTDTGVGIPADEINHVFDKFYRVGANNKQAKGTGLGLNLVRQIVEKVHNGRVFVASQVGVGSTFGFELPLAAAEMAGATR
ncbi:MAG: ATP-binding protein [Planctomycetota bacterium]|nr:ATP-binding protein [Planctomycetota bacterium]